MPPSSPLFFCQFVSFFTSSLLFLSSRKALCRRQFCTLQSAKEYVRNAIIVSSSLLFNQTLYYSTTTFDGSNKCDTTECEHPSPHHSNQTNYLQRNVNPNGLNATLPKSSRCKKGDIWLKKSGISSKVKANPLIFSRKSKDAKDEKPQIHERLNQIYEKVLVVDYKRVAAEVVVKLTNQYRHLIHACNIEVYDEVILEGPTESAAVAKAIVLDCMSKPFDGENILRVGLYVDAECAENWYSAKCLLHRHTALSIVHSEIS